MVILYYKIFKAIHDRAKKAIGSRKTYSSTTSDAGKAALVIENTSQTRRFQDEVPAAADSSIPTLNNKVKNKLPLITETDAFTVTAGSGSQEEEEDNDQEKDEVALEIVECHIIKNQQTTETDYVLNVSKGSQKRLNVNTQSPIEVEVTIGPNGNTNTDSGYAPSNIEETQFCVQNPNIESPTDKPSSPLNTKSDAAVVVENINKNGTAAKVSTSSSRTASPHATGQNHHHHQKHNDSISHSGSTTASTGASLNTHIRQPKKKSRFNLGRKHKSSRKKREKASAKRERKATKTLAIVLGTFLSFIFAIHF